ncbi:hypothetical protein [Desulfofundulus thermosubterraneus]|uniref:Uncharacterized protein n=1 Tax=Desulfofundulus thermosubterraneus DSM 16057 TaxID=1121432 RepID=A0A1M6EVY2_9FIRM|nr:hypothetical protein [Desulfofundulus thermosubterraneus]SHI89576.1 hypothetical protein SAMN02745219_01300 [Desulfofundulus thermosubterraneus DSM 16057]
MSEIIEKRIGRYETLLKEMWAASSKYLGTFSVNLLVERVVWEVSLEYKEIELLQYDQNGISCAKMAAKLEENPDLPVEDMFIKFITRYVEILARLLGHERAEEIKKKLDEEFAGDPAASREE